MFARRGLLPLTIGFFLTGCVVTSNVSRYTDDPETFFQYAASDRDFTIVVKGNPFAASQVALTDRVTAAFQKAQPSVNANFTSQPNETARKPYKAVVLFNSESWVTAEQICGQPDEVPIKTTAKELRIRAVFCDDLPISEISATATPLPSFNDPEFDNALVELALRLFPPTQQFDDRDHRLVGQLTP